MLLLFEAYEYRSNLHNAIKSAFSVDELQPCTSDVKWCINTVTELIEEQERLDKILAVTEASGLKAEYIMIQETKALSRKLNQFMIKHKQSVVVDDGKITRSASYNLNRNALNKRQKELNERIAALEAEYTAKVKSITIDFSPKYPQFLKKPENKSKEQPEEIRPPNSESSKRAS